MTGWLYKQSTIKRTTSTALQYVLDRWDELTIYVEYGFLQIDTNHIENKVIPIACWCKNFLFCSTPKGAKAAAVIYTVMEPINYGVAMHGKLTGCRLAANSVGLNHSKFRCKYTIAKFSHTFGIRSACFGKLDL